MFPCVYVCGSVYVCVYAYVCMCVYTFITYVYMFVCMYTYICVSVCTRVGTPVCICYYLVLSVYTHPLFLYVFSCYPILHVIKRRPVTQLGLPPAACQGYLSSLRVLSAVSGRQICALSVFAFQFLVHFTEDSHLPMQFCRYITPLYSGARIIGRHTPSTYAVLPAYYTVVLWRRLIGRYMPVVKAVLHILSVRLIAGVSPVCSGLC